MISAPRMDCALDAAMSMIEGRWKAVVLCKLNTKGMMRFNHLLKDIDGISPRMLAKQLKELEQDGLISRKAYSEIPPRVEYTLTERGQSILPVLDTIAKWGLDNMFSMLVSINKE
ncbi:MAG: helix-turn-helix transcriptional regulator [Methanomassiliicoccaceae archaeon]|jgi:DNA-binding HxlR family transcriptional regulator|nr:helix-turn-helix transcriptional regulator [Methanomassiliicoccaceae archaeon]